jgi:hypothetical protein
MPAFNGQVSRRAGKTAQSSSRPDPEVQDIGCGKASGFTISRATQQDRTIRRSAGSFPVRFGIRALLSVWAEVIFVVGMTSYAKAFETSIGSGSFPGHNPGGGVSAPAVALESASCAVDVS